MSGLPYDPDHIWQLASGADAARAVFTYFHQGLLRDVGCGLLTASVYDIPNMRSRRVFSEDTAAYPTGNFKRLDKNLYFETVLEGKRHFSSTRIEEIAEVFFDWEKIRDLGYESNMNIPAIVDDTVIGTANLLDRKGHYNAERVARALAWQPVITLSFLLLLRSGDEEATFSPKAAHVAMEGA